jgi:hypothetical protein
MTDGTKPVAKFEAGNGISAAIWENEIEQQGTRIVVRSVTLERRFRNSESGDWQSSNSFRKGDLPLLQWCINRAFDWLIQYRGGTGELIAGRR